MFKALAGQIGILFLVVVMAFAGAGRMDYWQGWVFAGIMTLTSSLAFIAFWGKTGLVKERRNPGPGVKWWDKLFLAVSLPLTIIIVLASALDAGCFHWTAKLPMFLYMVSYAVCLSGTFIVFWAIRSNEFFSSVARIQADRGQKVVDGGPYKFVRHPGYTGTILFTLAMPLILGSLYGLIVAGIVAAMIIARTALEDRMLRKELPGYAEYANKTRYRLVPGLW